MTENIGFGWGAVLGQDIAIDDFGDCVRWSCLLGESINELYV